MIPFSESTSPSAVDERVGVSDDSCDTIFSPGGPAKQLVSWDKKYRS